jgi:hypothetical protein
MINKKLFIIYIKVNDTTDSSSTETIVFASEQEDPAVEVDFETALLSEVKEIKTKKHKILAIRNDVKGVVFFKANSDVDVPESFLKLISLVKERLWKPK